MVATAFFAAFAGTDAMGGVHELYKNVVRKSQESIWNFAARIAEIGDMLGKTRDSDAFRYAVWDSIPAETLRILGNAGFDRDCELEEILQRISIIESTNRSLSTRSVPPPGSHRPRGSTTDFQQRA
jgi:hypothetical protein